MRKLDKKCLNGHERIIHFGDECPLCREKSQVKKFMGMVQEGLNSYIAYVFNEDVSLEPKKKGKLLAFKRNQSPEPPSAA